MNIPSNYQFIKLKCAYHRDDLLWCQFRSAVSIVNRKGIIDTFQCSDYRQQLNFNFDSHIDLADICRCSDQIRLHWIISLKSLLLDIMIRLSEE